MTQESNKNDVIPESQPEEIDLADECSPEEGATSPTRDNETDSYGETEYSSDDEMCVPKIFSAAYSSHMKLPLRKRKASSPKPTNECFNIPVIKEADYNLTRPTMLDSQLKQDRFDEGLPHRLTKSDFELSSEFVIGSKMMITIGILKDDSLQAHSRIKLLIAQHENQLQFSAYLFLNKCIKKLQVGFYTFADRKGISQIPINNGEIFVDFYSDKHSRWAKIRSPHPEYHTYTGNQICMCSSTFAELIMLLPCLTQIFQVYVTSLMQCKLEIDSKLDINAKCRRRLQF